MTNNFDRDLCVKEFIDFFQCVSSTTPTQHKILYEDQDDRGKHMYYKELKFSKKLSGKYIYNFTDYSVKSRTQEKTIHTKKNEITDETTKLANFFCNKGIYLVNCSITDNTVE